MAEEDILSQYLEGQQWTPQPWHERPNFSIGAEVGLLSVAIVSAHMFQE
jgi:hypothetical protein